MLYANLLLNVLYHIEIEMKIRESCLQTGNFIYKPGISLTKQDFHLQRGSLGLQRGFSGYYLPNESGIELLKWTKTQNLDVVTIFCTCYADFNYAKKAVELQCFDYYLKPISIDDFEK